MVSPWPSHTTWSPAAGISEERQTICQVRLSTFSRSSSKRSGSRYTDAGRSDGSASDGSSGTPAPERYGRSPRVGTKTTEPSSGRRLGDDGRDDDLCDVG